MDDLRIDNLRESENLSVRSCNVLKQNGFFYLSQVLIYFKQNKDFAKFRNCGLKSQEELTHLCTKYLGQYENINNNGDKISFEASAQSLRISESDFIFRLKPEAKVFLKKNGFVFVNDVVEHYERCRSFMTLLSCKRSINTELTLFVKKVKSSTNGNNSQDKHDELSSLDGVQYGLLDEWFNNAYLFLPVRARNVLENVIKAEVTLRSYYRTVIQDDTDLTRIRNSGEKTITDIGYFNQRLSTQLATIKNASLKIDNEFTAFAKEFSGLKNLSYELLLNFEQEFIDNRFPLFKIFLKHFLTPLNFKEKHLKVLQHFILKKHSNIYLRDIAEPLGYSVERIRQLKPKLLLEALSFFDFDSKTAHTIIAHTSYIQQTGDCVFLNKIRKYYFDSEIADIQDSIIYKAIGNIFKYTHSLFFRENEQDKVFAFLISNDITNLFDIESFTNDMESKTKRKRTKDESLNFEGYIFSFVKKFEQASFERVKKVCETIVENGFNTIVTIDGNIIFPQNANKNLPELVLEVLQKLGRPAHVTEITSELQIAYADREFSETSIRSSALRIPSIISFGRTSTYGLKEWEIEKEGIRGGTIRDIVQEFLEKFDVPKHILEIEEYVLRFRDTNEKNIITNLKLDTDRRFVFFPGGAVGLTSKKYTVNSNTFNRLPNYAPQLVKKLLKNKKISVQEIEQLTIETFGVDQYQARYWLRQHMLKGTFSKFLIE